MNAMLFPRPVPSGRKVTFVESVALLPKRVQRAIRRADLKTIKIGQDG